MIHDYETVDYAGKAKLRTKIDRFLYRATPSIRRALLGNCKINLTIGVFRRKQKWSGVVVGEERIRHGFHVVEMPQTLGFISRREPGLGIFR